MALKVAQGPRMFAVFKLRAKPADPRCVPEIGLVIALVVLLVAGGLLAPLLSATVILNVGVLAVAAGLALGVPTSFVYHVKLARVLAARGELPPRWWLSPTRLHGRLRGAERSSVLRWFFVGGAGFVITLAGCVAAFAGALLAE